MRPHSLYISIFRTHTHTQKDRIEMISWKGTEFVVKCFVAYVKLCYLDLFIYISQHIFRLWFTANRQKEIHNNFSGKQTPFILFSIFSAVYTVYQNFDVDRTTRNSEKSVLSYE